MPRFLICYYIFLLCLSPNKVLGQPVERYLVKTMPGHYLRFDRFTVKNDVFKQASSKRLQLHDSRGYLWFLSLENLKTQLIRYDGMYSKSYVGDSLGYFGPDGYQMVQVKENEDREIWIATQKGLCYFNPVNETWQPFRNPYTVQQSIKYWIIGKGGQQWFTTSTPSDKRTIQSFFVFNSRTRKVRKISPGRLVNGFTQQTEVTQPVRFRPIAVDKIGRVWGDVYMGSSKLGYYDPIKNRLVWFPLKALPGNKSTTFNLNLRTITDIRLEGQYIWVGSLGKVGLMRFDLRTGHWKQFLFSSVPYNRIFQIVPRNKHQFWLETEGSLALFDLKNETLYTYPDQTNKATPPLDQSEGQLSMQHQALWIGLNSGKNNATVRVLNETHQYFKVLGDSLKNFKMLYKNGNKLYFSFHDDHQNLVFAEYNEPIHRLTSLYNIPLQAYVDQNFYFALRDSVHQTVWLIGNTLLGHIFRFDERTQRLSPVKSTIQEKSSGVNERYKSKDFKKEYNLFSEYEDIRMINIPMIAQDKLGNIWFPTDGSPGGDLIKFDQKSQKFIVFKAGSHGLPKGGIQSILSDQQGKLWLGYENGMGVYLFDPKSNQASFAFKISYKYKIDILGTIFNSGVIGLLDDSTRQVIWVALSAGGIWKYDRRTQFVQRVCREPVFGGGPYGSEFYLGKSGSLWFVNLKGLIQFNPKTGRHFYFGASYDLKQDDDHFLRLVKTFDDEFFIDKFRFYESAIRIDTIRPNIVFSYLKVFDREISLSRSLNYTTELELRHNQNFFTIGFSCLSYFQQERNQYAYRLLGFDKTWISTGNNPSATFTNIPPGHFTLQVRSSNYNGVWSTIRSLQIVIHPPFWQTGWFRLLLFILFITVLFIFYRFQLERRTLKARLEVEEARRQQKEAELSEKEAAFQLKLSQTEMAALRSQMNPHFIFNCLNSIQYFTAQNDSETASSYLAVFSRLIRLVLENSKSEKVTLANELDTLRLYIELEAMRFPQKLRYQIQLSQEIDADEVLIPPLILQPFVENAIWHGLMHKDEGGEVKVKIGQPDQRSLHIEITDNGVGRAKAAEYKSKSATRTKSFGMKITAERIGLINQLYSLQTQVKVVDLFDDHGQALGTSVVIDIPI